MTVLFLDSVHPLVAETLTAKGYTCIEAWTWSAEEIKSRLPEADVLVLRSRYRMDADFLSGAEQLKWIARSGVGMENIDEAYCQSKGIRAFNAAGGNADAVGEHVIGMLLALFNKLASGNDEVRAGIWRREAHRGLELGHRTIGIIGFGHTGQSLAKKLSGFGTRVLAYDKYAPVNMEGVQSASLNQIQHVCDILSFHVPLNDETRHYLNEAFIQDMEHPFYLVNAARGSVASTEAIVKGLETKKILGACLDVLEEEDASLSLKGMDGPAFQKLITHKNVLLSPHVAGWTVESHVRLAEVLLERILELDV